MKKFNLFLLFVLLLSAPFALEAQNNIKFEIRHWLGDKAFAMDTVAQNNLSNDFYLSRLQYYISEISITHDTGKVTLISDYWMLVNTQYPVLVDLGSHAIDQVEAISFHVGVDQAVNHLDPAQYPAEHPLAPKAPSMHWGWASGYRFVAIEGYGGANLDKNFQLHGLGDDNYFTTSVQSPLVTTSMNERTISLDADYTRVLENIDVSNGTIVHGDYGDAKTAIINFQNYVFTPAVPNTTSIQDDLDAFAFELYPNPSTSGVSKLRLAEAAKSSYSILVYEVVGKEVFRTEMKAGQHEAQITLDQPGLYIVSLRDGNKLVKTSKLIVK